MFNDYLSVMPISVLNITSVEFGVLSLVVLLGCLCLAMSENYMTVKSQEGMTWRDYNTKKWVDSECGAVPFVCDFSFHQARNVINRDLVYRIALKFFDKYMMRRLSSNGYVVFSKYIVRMDLFLAILLVHKIYDRGVYSFVPFPLDVIFIIVVFFSFINACICYNTYFNVVIMQNKRLTRVYKPFLKKTKETSIDLNEIEEVYIKPILFVFPFKAYSLNIALRRRGKIYIGVFISLQDIMSIIIRSNKRINVYGFFSDVSFVKKYYYSDVDRFFRKV